MERYISTFNLYNHFMKCLLARILPWLVDTGILSHTQKAYIDRKGMKEHLFCLKTAIDYFKREMSSKLYTVFLDFKDAFGTLPHKVVMLTALEEIYLLNPLWVYLMCITSLFSRSSVGGSLQANTN